MSDNSGARMMTPEEAANLLGVSVSDLRRAVHLGVIPEYRFGRQIRYAKQDLPVFDRWRMSMKSTRILRELERLRMLVDESERPPSRLTDDELKTVNERYRRMRMPPWADGKAIRALKAEARRLTKETGIQHHVDHIIPLQGDLVSGLHVHTNMQIITATENIRKLNRYEVGND